MSITFLANTPLWEGSVWSPYCACGQLGGEIFATFEEAEANCLSESRPFCGDEICAQYPCTLDTEDNTLFVNVSNQNAAVLLDTLGIMVNEPWEDRCVGSMEAIDFLSRILIGQAVSPVDAGIPATQNGIVVDMGRPEGYVDARLVELEEVAHFAIERGVKIYWS